MTRTIEDTHDPATGVDAASVDGYTRLAIALHWVLAIALLAQIAFGFYADSVPQRTPLRAVVVNWHKTAGVLIGLLVLARVAWRLRHRPPAPVPLPRWQHLVGSITHGALYVAMLVVPLSGYVASNHSKWGVKMFDRFQLPPWGVQDKGIYDFFNGMHKIGSWVLIALIAGHVAAALWHWYRRDGVFERMLPR